MAARPNIAEAPEQSKCFNIGRIIELTLKILTLSGYRKIILRSSEEKYRTLIPQIKALIEGEPDIVARMANAAAAVHGTFGFLWTGFYRVVPAAGPAESPGSSELALGPFQGPVACSRIAYGKGVCGTAWREAKTQVVYDVEQFPGHIRCSSAAKSEIVVPVFRTAAGNSGHQAPEKTVIAVLDIDSAALGTFDMTDAGYLEEVCRMISA